MTQPSLTTSQSYRAALNGCWAGLMLEELMRLGVQHVCIAPGSRSTPLTLAAAKLTQLTIHTHFDERGLGFLALGLAKASQSPVAVIVTSGTAVANLLPAVAETGLTGEKLVLLTSDRPAELIQCGANQAIRQHGIFSDHVSHFLDIPSPSLDISPNWLLCAIDDVMQQQQLRGGSVHFNCHYPEPLYGDDVDFYEYLMPVAQWQQDTIPYCQHQALPSLTTVTIDHNQWQTLCTQKGVIVAGRLAANELKAVQQLAATLGWPLLVDPQAGGSSDYAGFDGWLQNIACHDYLQQAQVLLQFGGRLVSKRLLQLISHQTWHSFLLIDPLAGRLDSSHRRSQRIQANIEAWAQAAMALTTDSLHSQWALPLVEASQCYFDIVAAHANRFSELGLAAQVMQWIAPETELFLGNSMIVRLLDMCAKLPLTATFANRGASGIDGLIATTAGVQRARKSSLVCLIGDTSLLYDLNSLALLNQQQYPIVVIVTNNDGGGIFDMLPVPDQQKDDFYRMPHGFEFSHAAAMFGLQYCAPTSLSAAEDAIRDGQLKVGTTLVEIRTPAGEAGAMLKALFAEVEHATLF
ncbi:2-succinyl-5-enolpyruvyl-6-hydroxy-3-cyclohexene-1-carboxylic-acid synthase [Photobacterium toruni]|uniref:2-succinyl-5-enolpyruvyl-6-hydroxy-3-cyclohexene-1-carboxylate synthase n=1 Tax=Photobacterium toruni TaxID=1935446 RepID=A0A1T4NHP7_9GAMM|nr:2-succinyl-5-enolpyruvyl-6-hydroxy-3-cyclohexene-1-carboxylic-acid synthase [Photobacterium toruni]SJZ78587.1 2-succinyl-5-enolpyruvyl-6-hydroxy-3-cyclohexene-1-carboxylate synthase [Photobacterium toruni]